MTWRSKVFSRPVLDYVQQLKKVPCLTYEAGLELMDTRLGNGGGVRTVCITPIADTIFM